MNNMIGLVIKNGVIINRIEIDEETIPEYKDLAGVDAILHADEFPNNPNIGWVTDGMGGFINPDPDSA